MEGRENDTELECVHWVVQNVTGVEGSSSGSIAVIGYYIEGDSYEYTVDYFS